MYNPFKQIAHTISSIFAKKDNPVSQPPKNDIAVPEIPPGVVKGKCKRWSDVKGYGFLSQENGSDVFVHHTAILGEGYKTLVTGQEVTFKVTHGPKGLLAVDVTKLQN